MSEQIHIRVSEGKKAEWKRHKENHTVDGEQKYNSFSDLIREAVDNQIRTDNGGDSPDFDIDVATPENGKIDELLSAVERIEQDVKEVDENVSQAVDAVHAQEGIDPDVAPDILTALPVGKKAALTTEEVVEESPPQHTAAEVRFALEDLQRNAPSLVKSYVPFEEGKGRTDAAYSRLWYKTEE